MTGCSAVARELAKRGNSRYSTEEIERALMACALVQGNTRRAAQLLKAEGIPIPRSTLKDWITGTHRDRYAVISNEESRHLYARLADSHEAIAERIVHANEKAVGKIEKKLDDPDVSLGELSNTSRNLSVSAGIHQDKASLIRGRPTEIRNERSLAELLQALKSPRFNGVVEINEALLEGHAVEIPDDGDD